MRKKIAVFGMTFAVLLEPAFATPSIAAPEAPCPGKGIFRYVPAFSAGEILIWRDALPAFEKYLAPNRSPFPLSPEIWFRGAPGWGPWSTPENESFVVIYRERPAAEPTKWRATMTRPRQTIAVQVMVQSPDDVINRRGCEFDLKPSSAEWRAEVEKFLPTQEEVLANIKVNHYWTDSEHCPAIDERVRALEGLTIDPIDIPWVGKDAGEHSLFADERTPTYELSAANITITVSGDSPAGRWVEESERTFEACWRPGFPPNDRN